MAWDPGYVRSDKRRGLESLEVPELACVRPDLPQDRQVAPGLGAPERG